MMIVHRCRTCGHRESWHDQTSHGDNCSNGVCGCAAPDIDPNPELVPTYHNNTPVMSDGLNPEIVPPGQAMNPHCPLFSHRVVACDCQNCRTLHQQLTR